MSSALFDKAGRFNYLDLQNGTMMAACGMVWKLRLKGYGLRPYFIQISARVIWK
jgi:hypothetical protein